MSRFLSPNETFVGTTSGKDSYWDNVYANNLLSANEGFFTQNVTAYEFIGIGKQLSGVAGTDDSKLPLSGGELTGPLTGTEGLFTISLSAPNLSGAFYGDGSKLSGVSGIDGSKLPLAGGVLTGPLTGTIGLFTVSLSAPNLSGAFYGDGSGLTNVAGTDIQKLPLSGGELTGPLTGTEGLFTISLSAPNLSGSFIGNGSKLTGVSGIDGSKLPLAGGVLTGPLTGTTGLFTVSLSAPNLSGAFYGDGSGLTNVTGTDNTKLPLSGGRIDGNLVINGALTALSSATFVNTIFTTTSAISVVNTGAGPALYVFQTSGPYDIASFYDQDYGEVFHIGNDGKVGVKESDPNKELTVNGEISAKGDIWADKFRGDGSLLTNLAGTDVNKLPLSGGTLTGGITGTSAIFNSVSAGSISGTFYGDLSNGINVPHYFVTLRSITNQVGTMNTGVTPNTFTYTASGTLGAIETVTPVVGDIILLVSQSTQTQNGPWKVVNVGSPTSQAVLERPSFYSGTVKNGIMLSVAKGTTSHGFIYGIGSSTGGGSTDISVGSTNLTVSQAYARNNINAVLFANTFTSTQTLAVGSATTAPLRFQAGTLLTTPVQHSVEWDGNFMYLTTSGANSARTTNVVFVSAPATSSSYGLAGQVAYDSSFFYVCTAANTWLKTSLTNTGVAIGIDGTKLPLSGGVLTGSLTGTVGLFTTSLSAPNLSGSFYGNGSGLTGVSGIDGSKLPLAGGNLTGPLTGTTGLFTTSISSVSVSGTFYGDGSKLTGIVGTDNTKLPLSGGILTGSLTGTIGLFTTSLSAPNLSGSFYGNGSGLTNVIGTDGTKLPLSGGVLTGPLTGTTGLFTTSISSASVSGTFYGDGSKLTGIIGTDGTKLPLSGGVLTGPLTGTVGLFTTSLSAPNLSGAHFGDGRGLTNVTGTDGTKLPLSGGVLTGPLTGTTGLFTTSISSVSISGTHFGDGSRLTGLPSSGLPLSGGTLTGGLTGTVATFTTSISSPSVSGTFYGDGGNLYNIPSQINFIFDGSGSAVSLNSTGIVQIPYNVKIVSWSLLANAQANAEVQVLTSNYANHPTYSIISGTTNTPKLINASKAQSSTMSDWVTAIPADYYLQFTVISNDSATNLTISLKCLRTS